MFSNLVKSQAMDTREEAKRIQVQTFTRWCNARLATQQQKIDDLSTDLRDGTKLLSLLEILSKKSPGKFHKKPKNQAQRVENVDAALQFITQKEKINLANIASGDIADGSVEQTLELLWSIIARYQVASDVDISNEKDLFSLKDGLIKFLESAIQLPGRKVKNLTTDWNDGILVATLVDSVARGLCPECDEMVPANSFQNATQAMKLAEDWLGVLQLLHPEDMVNPNVDELSMMTYLSQFTKAKLKKGAPLRPMGNAANVKVSGPGVQSEGLNVSMPAATFTINIEGAGPGKLVILCNGPNGPVKVTAASSGANVYKCSYVPAAEGTYQVDVYFCRVPVPGSPFLANVSSQTGKALPLVSSSGSLSISGRSPDHNRMSRDITPVGEIKADLNLGADLEGSLGDDVSLSTSESLVTLPQIYLEAPVSEQLLEAWIEAPNGKSSLCTVDKQGEGFKLSFVPHISGTHYAHIKIPFNISELQLLSFDGSEAIRTSIGKSVEWQIKDVLDSKKKLKINVVGPKNSKVSSTKLASNIHAMSFVPAAVGVYLVHVTQADKPVRGSPFMVKVSNPKDVKLTGPGVKKLGGNMVTDILSLGGVKVPNIIPFTDKLIWSADVTKAALLTSDLVATISGPDGYQKELEVVQSDSTHASIPFAPPKCGSYRLQVTADGQEIPQSPVELTLIDPSISIPSAEQDITLPIEDDHQESPQPPEASNLPELSIDASVGDEEELDAWIKAPNGKILPCNVDKQGDKFKLSFLPFVTGIHEAHISAGDKPVKGSPFQINVTPQQTVTPHGPELVLMGVGSPLEWTMEGVEGKGKLKVNVVGPKKCKAALKKNADKSHTVVLTPSVAGTYLVHITDGGKPVRGSPFVVKVTNPKSVKLSGPGIKKGGLQPLTDLLLSGMKTSSGPARTELLPISDQLEWFANLASTGLFCSDLKATIYGSEGYQKDLETVQMDPTHSVIKFSPPKCGPYKLQVTAAGQVIPQCPVDISLYDVNRISVTGPGMETGCVGKPVLINIDATQAGEGSLSLKIDGPANILPTCTSDKQGLFLLKFDPPKAGTYKLFAKFYDQSIPGSPFSINISDPAAGPESITISGAGREGGILSGKVAFNVKLPAGFDDRLLNVTALGPNAVCDVTRSRDNHGSLRFEYTPTLAGPYSFDIMYEGKHVTGSPFEAIWVRPPPDASKCSVAGIEKHGKFSVDCRNGGGNGFLEIAVFGAYCPAENINVQHNGDYTFDVTYKIFRPGKTTISVKWHNVHLVGSPFTVITV